MFKIIIFFTFAALAKGILIIRVPLVPENVLQAPPGHQLKFVHVNLGSGGPHTFGSFPRVMHALPTNSSEENSKEVHPDFGSMIKKIMQRSHENGQHLLHRYGPLLGSQNSEPFHPRLVILRAPASNAIRNSVQSAFRGLTGEPFSKTFIGKPIEHHSSEVGLPRGSSEQDSNEDLFQHKPLMDDIMRAHDPDSCPAFHKKFQNQLKSSGLLSTFKPRIGSIFNKFPELDNDIANLPSLHDLHENNLLSGDKKPGNYSKKDELLIKHITRKMYAIGFSTTPLKRLAAGRYISHLLDEIKDQMLNDDENPDQKKMSLFGSTSPFLKAIMSAIGGENGLHNDNSLDYPKPGSMFVVEVYQKIEEQTYHVRLHYKNGKGPLTDNHIVQVKGCEVMCEFNKFKNLLNPMRLTKEQADKECADV